MKTLLTAMFLMATALMAAPSAALKGRVTDAGGAAIPGAQVKVTGTATGQSQTIQTNVEGIYVFASLPAGRYDLEISKDRFRTEKRRGVVLNVSGTATQDVQLEIGAVSSSVEVRAGNTLVDKDGISVGTVVDRTFAANLPMNGRSFQTLLELTPGITLVPVTTYAPGQFVVNGQRSNSNYFTVDGVSANIGASVNVQTHQQASGTVPGFTALGGTNNLVSVDALEEFRVLTSTFAPEYGRMPGGQISLVTRSGTNEFHGSAYEYFRNEKMDANNWFSNAAATSRAPLRQNNFGGTLGGPAVLPGLYKGRNRTFFFLSYEGQRNRLPRFSETLTPTKEIREQAIEDMRDVLNMYPLPNAPSLAGDPVGVGRYVASYGDPASMNAVALKVNHQLTSRISLFGRVNHAPTESTQRAFVNQYNSVFMDTDTCTAGMDYAITPHVFNEARVNYSHYTGTWDWQSKAFDGAGDPPLAKLLPAGASLDTSSVSIQLMSSYTYGTPPNLTLGRVVGNGQNQVNLVDNFSVNRGTHTIKTGVDWRRLTPLQSTRSVSYSYAFGTILNAATTGTATTFSVQGFAPPAHYHFDNFSWYAQDSWQVTPRLTFTYGTRWEVNPPPGERDGRLPYTVLGMDNPLTATVPSAGTQLWDTTYGNFAPRLGAAYRLSKRHELVLRGGWGLYYDLGTGQATRGYSSFPYSTYRSIANVRFPATGDNLKTAAISTTPPFSAEFYAFPNLKLPYSHQWNVTVEKAASNSGLLTLSWVGAAGRRLLGQESFRNRTGLTQLNPAYFSSGSTVYLVSNRSTSDYNALQAQYRRRLDKGLQAQVSYTWGKSLDDLSDENTVTIPAVRPEAKLERGRTDFDIRHTFNFGVTYDIPGVRGSAWARRVTAGWGLDVLGRFRTASPANVQVGQDLLNVGVTAVVRPDLVAGVPTVLDDPNAPGGRRLNSAAFKSFTESRQGTLGRNALNGFNRLRQVDLGVRRTFALAETLRLEFRAEMFNLTNTPAFGNPTSSLTNSKFGLATATLNNTLGSFGTGGSSQGFAPLYQVGGPRSAQLSLRLSF